MALLMLFSVCASGCTLNPEWSYKTSEKTLAIGVYLTAMQEAYAEAQNYAAKLDDYDASSDKWLDMEITDDLGNTQVAREWIKDTAERACLELLMLEPELQKLGATTDEAALANTLSQLETQWVTQDKAVLEKLGVSLDSYKYYKSSYNRLREELFNLLYGEGGSQAVAKDEILKYLTENYGRYAAVPVSLYESTTDEAGSQTTVALSDEKVKEITTAIDGIVKKVNAEKDTTKAAELSNKLLTEFVPTVDMTAEQIQNVTLTKDNNGISDKDLAKAVKDLEEGKAVAVKIGEKPEEQTYFYLFRYNNDSLKENYTTDGVTDDQVLHKMKAKDYTDYLKSLIDKMDYEKSGDVDKYDPNIFFSKTSSQTSVVAQ